MPTQDDILKALTLLEACKPEKQHGEITRQQMGFFAVIEFLTQSQKAVTPREISTEMGVSSARMTVLLKKLESEGLITRNLSPTDRRSLLVELNPKGKRLAQSIYRQKLSIAESILEEFELDELEILLQKFSRIHEIFSENMKHYLKQQEDSHD